MTLLIFAKKRSNLFMSSDFGGEVFGIKKKSRKSVSILLIVNRHGFFFIIILKEISFKIIFNLFFKDN